MRGVEPWVGVRSSFIAASRRFSPTHVHLRYVVGTRDMSINLKVGMPLIVDFPWAFPTPICLRHEMKGSKKSGVGVFSFFLVMTILGAYPFVR